jgi:hypothetical protein
MTTEANIMMTPKTVITASKPSFCTPMPLVDAVEHVESRGVAVIDQDGPGCPRILFDRILLNVKLDHVVWNFDVFTIGGG